MLITKKKKKSISFEAFTFAKEEDEMEGKECIGWWLCLRE